MKQTILLVISLLVLCSCQFETTAKYHTGDFETVLGIASTKGKPIWMILGGGKHCESCNQLIEDMKEEDIFKKYQNDYVFFRCNVEEPENTFLKYIFLMEAIPNSYIVSPEGKVYSYLSGQLKGKDIERQFMAIRDNQPYYPARHSQFKSDMKKLLYLQNLLITICLRNRHAANDTSQLRSLLPDLKKSIDIEPYFYNLYLSSRIFLQLGDSLQSKQYAQKALQCCPDGFQTIIYTPLISELHRLLNTENARTPQAYIKFENTQLDIKNKDSNYYIFRFKNTGGLPLLVKHVSSSCGCAKATWDKQPILPGGEGEIKIIYNPKENNAYTKTFWIQTNATNKVEKLILKGTN